MSVHLRQPWQWFQSFELFGHPAKLTGTYNLKEQKNFLSKIALSGSIASGVIKYIDRINVGYEVSHSFLSKAQELKLSAGAKGVSIMGTLNSKGIELSEVAAQSKVSLRS